MRTGRKTGVVLSRGKGRGAQQAGLSRCPRGLVGGVVCELLLLLRGRRRRRRRRLDKGPSSFELDGQPEFRCGQGPSTAVGGRENEYKLATECDMVHQSTNDGDGQIVIAMQS